MGTHLFKAVLRYGYGKNESWGVNLWIGLYSAEIKYREKQEKFNKAVVTPVVIYVRQQCVGSEEGEGK